MILNKFINLFLLLSASAFYLDRSWAQQMIAPPTLCKKNEKIFVTCGNKKTEKIMSICAFPKEKNNDFEFIEYRFGTNKKLELAQRFTYKNKNFSPLYRGIDLNFNVNYGFLRNEYYYAVSVPQETLGAVVSVWVRNVKTKERQIINCSQGLDYWDGEGRLTSTKLIKEANGDEVLFSEDGFPK